MGFVICCDFDGTVTEKDTIISIVRNFAPKESEQTVQRILNKEISVAEGVSVLFSMIPSAQKEAVIEYVKQNIPVRPGFQGLLNIAREKHIPFYIVSGGMHFFIDPILEQFEGIDAVFANEVDFSGETMTVKWTHACDDECPNGQCGTCKPTILRTVNSVDDLIVIGDSLTDCLIAQESDVLFATSDLVGFAETEGLDYYPFETFDDITERIKELI